MTRLYVPQPLESAELHPLLAQHFNKEVWMGLFGNDLPPNFFSTGVEYVDDAASAQAILLPNNFRALDDSAQAYIATYADMAKKANIPLYVFAFGDSNEHLAFDPRAWVFCLSVYGSSMRPRDIVVPTTAQDFGDITLRPKAEKPVVSFCGFAAFKTPRQWLGYMAKNVVWEVRSWANPVLRARKQGIYWRRAVLGACARSGLVRTNFILRRSFSGAARTIELDPAQARKEFIASIVDADFVLTPKGDGNYSNRFLETLALGRIPVLVDTDMVLPGKEYIPYEKIMVHVPMRDVRNTPRYIRAFYDSLSPSEWEERQHLARSVFTDQLRQDVFFKRFFVQTHGEHTT